MADQISTSIQRFKKTGLLSSRILGFIVVGVVFIFVYRFIASSRTNSASGTWFKLSEASTVPRLEEVAKLDPNGYASKIAEVDLARTRLTEGISELRSNEPEARKKGVENVEKARADFVELAKTFKDDRDQKPWCLWGAAKAEESLIGVLKEGSSLEHRGLVSKAVEYYQQVAESAGGTQLGEAAKARAELLNKSANEITSLQSELYRPSSTALPPNDPFHPRGTGPKISIPGFSGGPELKDPTPPTQPAAKVAPAPKVETPVAPGPKVEAPVAPTPAPNVETPVAPAPKTDAPATPAPKIETPVAPTPPAKP